MSRQRQPELIVRLVQTGHVSAEAFRGDSDDGVVGLVDVSVRPMMFGSLPNRTSQTRWLITASASAVRHRLPA